MNDILVLSSVDSLRMAKEQLKDTDAGEVLDLVLRNVSRIEQFLKNENPQGVVPAAGMCLATARYVNGLVQQIGMNARVLAGELEIGPNSWLEHYLSFVEVEDLWILIDFTVGQLERYQDVSFMVIISPRDRAFLLAKLSELFNWC